MIERIASAFSGETKDAEPGAQELPLLQQRPLFAPPASESQHIAVTQMRSFSNLRRTSSFPHNDGMTVRELRRRISTLDDCTHVAVYWENADRPQFFGIESVSLRRGTPSRAESHNASFTFDNAGPEAWGFISVSPESPDSSLVPGD